MKSARLFKIERFMHRLALCGLAVALFAVPCVAQVQPGSTGGSIGKIDKSISGGGSAAEPSAPTKSRSNGKRPVDTATSDQSSVSVAGAWRWSADCTGSGRWQGQFDLIETSRGGFNGSFEVGTITNGRVNGRSVTFTRTWITFTQYWTGRLVGGQLKGTLSGNGGVAVGKRQGNDDDCMSPYRISPANRGNVRLISGMQMINSRPANSASI
jgi:hypothetical protein